MKLKISKEKFQAYEDIRESGITNMFAIDYIIKLSIERGGEVLTRQDIFEIMLNYNLYKTKYLLNNNSNNNNNNNNE